VKSRLPLSKRELAFCISDLNPEGKNSANFLHDIAMMEHPPGRNVGVTVFFFNVGFIRLTLHP